MLYDDIFSPISSYKGKKEYKTRIIVIYNKYDPTLDYVSRIVDTFGELRSDDFIAACNKNASHESLILLTPERLASSFIEVVADMIA
jgi:hypothetical protein